VCDGYHHCQDASDEKEGCHLFPEEGGGCASVKVSCLSFVLIDCEGKDF
jgi:hypothetical protein